MLLQITNKCDNHCKHCLQACDEQDRHMSDGVFFNAIWLAKRVGVGCIMLSGGEPTLHPKFVDWLEFCCKNFHTVIVATNGNWMMEKTHAGLHLNGALYMFPNLIVQITSVPGIYPHHKEIVDLYNEFYSEGNNVRERVLFADRIEAMRSLGRAVDDAECMQQAAAAVDVTTSCLSASLAAVQIGFADAVHVLESRAKICHPLIDWQGGVHWSESWLCPSFFTLPSHLAMDEAMYLQLSDAAQNWRPCGSCADYKKLLNNPLPKYVRAREILGIPQPHLNKEQTNE